MKTYSPERKAAVIAKMMPPHNQSIIQIARSEGTPATTGRDERNGVAPYVPVLFAGMRQAQATARKGAGVGA